LVPEAEWKPIAFPFVLERVGRLQRSMGRDFDAVRVEISERAAERGLPPFAPPDSWPLEAWSFHPLRAALFAEEQGRQREFTRAAYRKAFVDSRALTELENVIAAARDAGLEPAEVEEAIERQDIKDRLKANTEEALARGVTGIPTVAVEDELFWGDDRLEEAAQAAVGR
jgi:2-hydroxychromene-2-carboxylate isomerase